MTQSGEARSLRAAEVLDVLVVALWRGGKASNDEAVTFAERAISIKQQLLGNEDPRLATSLDNAGVLFFVRGEYERARQHYQRALAILSAAAASEPRYEAELGKVHSHLGPLYQELGQYSTAREHYEQALRAFLKAVPRDDQQVAMTRNNLATLMVKIGDYEEASTLYAQALAALETRLGAEHPLIASGKHNVAELNQRMGRDTEAIELYRQAIALKEKTLGGKHPSLALSLSNLSYLYTDRREIGPAVELATRAVQIQETASGATHVDLAYGLISLGRAQTARGDTEDARRTLTRALELRSAALGAENPLLVPPLYFLGVTLVAAGKPREAFDVALRAESIGREHLRLTTRAAPERQAMRYSAERLPSLDLVLSIASRLQDPAITRSSWDALIRSRAVVLDEMAARHRLANQESSAPLRKAFDDYRTAAESLSNVLLRGPTTNDLDRYQRTVAELRAGKEAAERALAAESETVRRGLAQQQIGFEEVRAALPSNTTLVAFARTRATAQAGGVVPRVRARDPAQPPRVVSLGPAQDIETAMRRWRDAMTPASAKAGKMPDPAAGERLRQLLWDPLQVKPDGRSAGADRSGRRHPSVELRRAATGQRASSRRSRCAHSLPVERARRDRRRPSAPRGDILVVGGASRGACCRARTHRRYQCLPGDLRRGFSGAARLAQRSAAGRGHRARCRHRGAHPVTELLGAAATETAFKQQVRGKSLVHVAAHGFFRRASVHPRRWRIRCVSPGWCLPRKAQTANARMTACCSPRKSPRSTSAPRNGWCCPAATPASDRYRMTKACSACDARFASPAPIRS